MFNVSGSDNVANGCNALYSNTVSYNTATGYQALEENTTGSNNIADGFAALDENSTGSYNTAIGSNADLSSSNLTYATAIGAYARVGRSNCLVLGGTGTYAVNVGVGTPTPNTSALLDLTSTTQGLLPPRIALTATNSSSPLAANVAGMILYNTATAGTSPNNVTPGYYYNNGTVWVRLTDANSPGWSLTGNAGTTPGTNFIGTTDNEDIIFKTNNIQAGLLDYTNENTSLGISALNPSSTGIDNTAMGGGALPINTTGYSNVAVGVNSMQSNLGGYYNVSVGVAALQNNTSGQENTAIGEQVLGNVTTGQFNTGIGDNTGGSNQTGIDNVAIGVGASVDGLENTVALGDNSSVTASNNMAFGSGTMTGWGFGGGVPTSSNVLVVGTNSTNGNGAYLTAGGLWTNGSDKNIKEDFSTLDSKDVLSLINQLPVTRWKYKGTSEYHIGPMAQDFYKAFNVGNDDKHISTIDPASVALIGVQALSTQNDSLQNTVNNLQQEMSIQKDSLQNVTNNLQQQLNDLKTTINQMQTAMSQCCNSYSSNMAKAAATPVVVTAADAPTLQQNTPNPYNGSTVIGYYLPQSTTNAEIIVSDLTGNVIKSISLNGTGNGQITFSAGSLAAGSYFILC